MDLNEPSLNSRLAGKAMGHPVHYFHEVDSTNTAAFRLAMQGAPAGTAVVADTQTKGKGRLSRSWQSPPACNIYTSLILRPQIPPAEAPQLTLVAGVAVVQALQPFCPAPVTLKWPNDVEIGGRKVCGILTEMRTLGGRIDFVVVGIGINVNIGVEALDEAFRQRATSLRSVAGSPLPRLDVLTGVFDQMALCYGRFLAEGFGPLRDLWLQYADLIGKPLEVAFKDDIQRGVVQGIDTDGALLLQDALGRVRRVTAGDASILKGPADRSPNVLS